MNRFASDHGIELIEARLLASMNAPTPDPSESWDRLMQRLPERRPSLSMRLGGWVRRPLAIAFATSALSTGAAYAAGLEPHEGAARLLERAAATIGIVEADDDRPGSTPPADQPADLDQTDPGGSGRKDDPVIDGFATAGQADEDDRDDERAGSRSEDDRDDRDEVGDAKDDARDEEEADRDDREDALEDTRDEEEDARDDREDADEDTRDEEEDARDDREDALEDEEDDSRSGSDDETDLNEPDLDEPDSGGGELDELERDVEDTGSDD